MVLLRCSGKSVVYKVYGAGGWRFESLQERIKLFYNELSARMALDNGTNSAYHDIKVSLKGFSLDGAMTLISVTNSFFNGA